MTTLHKLSIRGVRSYAPDEESIIKFQHPLTIIVGANGSGKTSIIECLKYLCSGEFPPLSDKGKSFVHDPDACGEPIVKGQIKLAFKTSSEKNVIAVKSFQVTAQKGRRTFKLIDSVLSTVNDEGSQKTVSYKCARMEELMTQLMGVSPPILENVIFCHQLDSDWPLSDDKSLKKRFDDIFAATKYTRALESIKKFRSEQQAKCKDLQRDLDVVSNNLETVQKVESDKMQLSKSLEALLSKWEDAKQQKQIQSLQVSRLTCELQEVTNMETRLAALRHDAEIMEGEVVQARMKLHQEYTEPTEELISRLEQFDQQLSKRGSKLSLLEKDYAQAIRNEEEMSTRYQDAIKSAGRVEVLQEQLAAKVSANEKMTFTLANLLSIDPQISESTSPQISEEFVAAVAKQISFKEHELEQYDATTQTQINSNQQQLNSLKEQLLQLMQLEQVETRQIALYKEQIATLDVDLTVTQRQQAQLLPLKEKTVLAEQQLSEHISKMQQSSIELKIEGLQRQLMANSDHLTTVSTKMRSLQASEESRRVVDVQRKLFEQAHSKLDEQYLILASMMANILGSSCPKDTMAAIDTVKGLAYTAQKSLSNAVDFENSKQIELSTLCGRRQTITDQLNSAQERIFTLQEQASSYKISTLEKLHEVILARQSERDRLDHSIRNSDQYARLFADWGAEAEHAKSTSASHSCGLCDRPFTSQELTHFVVRNAERVKILQSPEETAQTQRSLHLVKQQLQKLEHLRVILTESDRVANIEVPSISRELADVKTLYSECSRDFARLRDSRLECEKASKQYSEFIAFLDVIEDAKRNHSKAKEDLEVAEGRCSNLGNADADEVRAEYERLQSQSMKLTKELDSLRNQAVLDDQVLRSCQDSVQSCREQGFRSSQIEAKLVQLEQSLFSNKERHTKSQEALLALQEQQLPIQKDIEKIGSNLQQISQKAAATLRSRKSELTKIIDQHRLILGMRSEICQISDELSNIQDTTDLVSTLKHQDQTARQALRDLQTMLNQQRQAIATFEADRHGLKDNIEYRQRVDKRDAQVSLFRNFLQDLKKSHRPLSVVQIESDKAHSALMESEKIAAGCEGEHSAIFAQLSSRSTFLAEEKYRNVRTKHRDAIVDLETTKLLVADLDLYYRALDRSLMEYHSIKMREINDVLKELWQCTYQGKDIDTIAIRADHAEGANDLGAARQKKQYSYRLTMVQGDTELDMRGRSSAGQRVLASLLIRLALSETFCVRCGILALDEPTQNLDEANIRALADALNMLIDRRKGHENFQLILITHDEHFVELLRKRDNAEFYWRVFKDTNNCSRIKRIPINQ